MNTCIVMKYGTNILVATCLVQLTIKEAASQLAIPQVYIVGKENCFGLKQYMNTA